MSFSGMVSTVLYLVFPGTVSDFTVNNVSYILQNDPVDNFVIVVECVSTSGYAFPF